MKATAAPHKAMLPHRLPRLAHWAVQPGSFPGEEGAAPRSTPGDLHVLTLGFQAVGQTVRDTCGRVGGTGGTCSGGQRENENCSHLILTGAALPFPGIAGGCGELRGL